MNRDEKERLLLDLLPLIRSEANLAARKSSYASFEDLLQEASLATWVALDQYDPCLGQINTFLVCCIRHALKNHWLKAHRRKRFLPQQPAEATDGLTDRRRSVRPGDFDELLECCQQRERNILVALYREGYTQAEIGEQQNISHQFVSEIARRGMRRIREQITKDPTHANV